MHDVTAWAGRRPGRLGEVGRLGARIADRMDEDRALIVSAGLAFYASLSLVPAFVAAVSLYTLVTDPAALVDQAERLTDSTPEEVQRLVISQLLLIADRADAGASLWLVAGLVVWFWSASRFSAALIRAMNTIHGVDSDRGALHRRLFAIGVTVATVVIAVVGLGLGKAGSRAFELDGAVATVLGIVRWPIFFAVAVLGVALTYRFAPDRDDLEFRPGSPGVLLASGVWVLATIIYTLYMTTFGGVSSFYGSFGGLLGLQLWIVVSAFAVVLGAYVNVEVRDEGLGGRSSAPGRGGGDR